MKSIVTAALGSTANVSCFQLLARRRITKHECFGADGCVYARVGGLPC